MRTKCKLLLVNILLLVVSCDPLANDAERLKKVFGIENYLDIVVIDIDSCPNCMATSILIVQGELKIKERNVIVRSTSSKKFSFYKSQFPGQQCVFYWDSLGLTKEIVKNNLVKFNWHENEWKKDFLTPVDDY